MPDFIATETVLEFGFSSPEIVALARTALPYLLKPFCFF